MSKVIKFADEEAAVLELSRLYRHFGFKHFKMSKFEEYELYSQNKDFLLGSSVITFTDTNGSLMALKPDVTLSIVKGSNDNFDVPEKVYYSENVYRIDKGTHRFKEITQLGLESIGDLDDYSVSEVIMLAKASLNAISDRNILDISSMAFILGLLDGIELSDRKKTRLIECIRTKNTLEMENCCKEYGIGFEVSNALKALTTIYGPFEKCVDELKAISLNEKTDAAAAELETVYGYLKLCGLDSGINLDFSIVNDLNYYNGVIFNGFVLGVPNVVLSGGRYDNLMRKFGKKSGAIGFAVYLSELSRMMRSGDEYDVDTLILYDKGDDLSAIAQHVKSVSEQGRSVRVQRTKGGLKCRTVLKIKGTEVEIIENHD